MGQFFNDITKDGHDIPEILLRSILSVLFLFFLTKLMGKKQLSQLNFFDYVIGISIGSIAAQMAMDTKTSYVHAFVSMAVYTVISLAIAFGSLKSIKARQFFQGTPTILIYDGKMLAKGLFKAKININALLEECRLAGYFHFSDILYAIMESNGKISFLPKPSFSPVTLEDLKLAPKQTSLLSNVIIDGKFIEKNLEGVGKNIAFVRGKLKNQKVALEEVLLGTYDPISGDMAFYKKNENMVPHNYFD